ncbi:MAG TPA: helical backbone metal receptor, partial [Candidatus Dormibacteraeota bacterium]|nr:helical backbone metal receptor [Candidatus Dormibacteraeota bacterium]
CSGAASPAPTPTPTGTLAPALTTTPATSPSPSPSPSAAAFPLRLTDDQGTAVTIPAVPRHIVSLTPATTETVFALGAGDRLVGRTDFDDYPAEAKKATPVATYTSVDVEKIVSLGADLVLAGGNHFNDPAAIARLRGLGIPVLVVYAPDVATVLKDIDLVGEAIGDADAATALTTGMQADIDAVRAATASLPKPRTFYELDATKDIYGPADGSFLAQMLSYAGADPITTGSTTAFSIPLEKLVAADPQLILLGDAAYGTTPAQVKARPGWSVMTAVKTGAIRPVDDTIVTRPGPRLVQGLRALALAVHPDVALPSPAPSPSQAP